MDIQVKSDHILIHNDNGYSHINCTKDEIKYIKSLFNIQIYTVEMLNEKAKLLSEFVDNKLK